MIKDPRTRSAIELLGVQLERLERLDKTLEEVTEDLAEAELTIEKLKAKLLSLGEDTY
jgi:uncharacterized coiled-coil protein SlyX